MAEVSVLLPVFNGEHFLAESIESVLAQTWQAFELLVIDDASTDGSADIVKRFTDSRVRLLRLNTHVGITAALNRGLEAANGELVARQDADDISAPRRLERQVETFAARPELALVGSQGLVVTETGRRVADVDRPTDELAIRWYGLVDNPFIHTSVMFRRSVVWRELGGYDAAGPVSQDYALWCRVMERHRVMNLADRLIVYRVGSSSVTAKLAENRSEISREAFRRLIRTIIGRHAATLLGSSLPAGDLELLTGFMFGLEPHMTPSFLSLFQRLLAEYERLNPPVRQSRSFARTLARQYDALAYRVAPPDRAAAVRIYATALCARPRLVYALPWIRALALVTAGPASRHRLGRRWWALRSHTGRNVHPV